MLSHVELGDRLVCDLSGVDHLDPVCATIFATVANHPASRWPGTNWLHIAVRDGSSRLLRAVASDPNAPGGRGCGWSSSSPAPGGVNPRPDGGKVVSCTLKLYSL